MSTPFGPQLIGETEKTLNALLCRFLEGTGLTEAQWVTLRLADLLEGGVGARGLAAAVADRAQLPDAADLVSELTDRDLLDNGRLTSAGRDLAATVQSTITTETAPIWDHLPSEDVVAATRVLNEVLTRARAVLGDSGRTPRPRPPCRSERPRQERSATSLLTRDRLSQGLGPSDASSASPA